MTLCGRVGSNPTWSTTCRCGGNGIRSGFRGRAPKERVGSIPTTGIRKAEMKRVLGILIAFLLGFIAGAAFADKRKAEENDKGEYIHTFGKSR